MCVGVLTLCQSDRTCLGLQPAAGPSAAPLAVADVAAHAAHVSVCWRLTEGLSRRRRGRSRSRSPSPAQPRTQYITSFSSDAALAASLRTVPGADAAAGTAVGGFVRETDAVAHEEASKRSVPPPRLPAPHHQNSAHEVEPLGNTPFHHIQNRQPQCCA